MLGFLPGLTLLALGGCSETSFGVDGEMGIWEGELVDERAGAETELAGTVTMTSTGAETDIVMVISSGPTNEAFGWGVGFGSCDSPGQPLAGAQDFGFVELDGSGEAEVRRRIGGGFAQDNTFTAAIFPGVVDQSEPLACADLRPAEN